MNPPIISSQPVSKSLLVIDVLIAIYYFFWWLLPGHPGQPVLFTALFVSEIYHVFMALTFWFTLWPRQTQKIINHHNPNFHPSIDVFITVAGEPVDIVKKTIIAAQKMDYSNFKIHILNDGLVAKKSNWQEIQKLAEISGVNCITRTTARGAKAGNINHALSKTSGELVVIFDADMVPHSDFLTKTVPYFQNPKVGFVQTPQYYHNHQKNIITSSAWEQQEFFFGPIMRGKSNSNSAFICGTNVVIKRTAINQVGGFVEDNIAEDFLTSQLIHQYGWQSIYVPEVLSQGLAPEDLQSYFKQQLRWARGSLEIVFKQNPFFKKNLSLSQKIQYLASALYYFNGPIVLLDMILPLLFLFFNLQPVNAATTSFAVFFIPFMFANLLTLYQSSGGSLSFKAISFSISSWTLQLMALFSLFTGQKMGFSVTPKKMQQGNFIYLAYPHIAYIFLSVVGSLFALYRLGFSPSVATNMAWALFNSLLFYPFIKAAYPWGSLLQRKFKYESSPNPVLLSKKN